MFVIIDDLDYQTIVDELLFSELVDCVYNCNDLINMKYKHITIDDICFNKSIYIGNKEIGKQFIFKTSSKSTNYISKIFDRFYAVKTVVVPSRIGSSRCANKNNRVFNNTNLLQMKIDKLKKCKYIDKILISTNDKVSIECAKMNNVDFFERSEELCIGDVEPWKVHVSLASCIESDVFIYNTPTTPFVNHETIDEIIVYWIVHPEYDILCASHLLNNFVWLKDKPYNFTIQENGIKGTQDLDNNYCIACADSGLIAYKNKIIQTRCLFGDGNSIKMYNINKLECLDIDDNIDFVLAESLSSRCLDNAQHIHNYMQNKDFEKTSLCDCTLRDTGYLNRWNWSYDVVKHFVYYTGEIGIDYCEIGFLKNTKEDNAGFWRNVGDDISIIKRLKSETSTKVNIALMCDIEGVNDKYFDIDKLDKQNETGIDLIRVFSFFEIIDYSLEYCKLLKDKGYKISLNIGHCVHLTIDNINYIKSKINPNFIDILYFADSLGMMTPKSIQSFVVSLKDIHPIKLGFHNHDNNGIVLSNITKLLDLNIDMIDATISGFGKNGGNVNLEQLLLFLKHVYNYDINIVFLMKLLDNIVNVDFGNRLNVHEIKQNISQILKVHSSHYKDYLEYDFERFYDIVLKLQNTKKRWS